MTSTAGRKEGRDWVPSRGPLCRRAGWTPPPSASSRVSPPVVRITPSFMGLSPPAPLLLDLASSERFDSILNANIVK